MLLNFLEAIWPFLFDLLIASVPILGAGLTWMHKLSKASKDFFAETEAILKDEVITWDEINQIIAAYKTWLGRLRALRQIKAERTFQNL